MFIPPFSIIKPLDRAVGGVDGMVTMATRNSGADDLSMTTTFPNTPLPHSKGHLQAPLPHFTLRLLVGISSLML
ncbi:Hypp7731 [Branchiostoma lanceolatum]|uniref:Hypp7731 protein n=1 Tax=Branchiostoma lanceolatum TaxID=7740 RepID=A0A8J9Z2P8_BRALA|nr:Hypp7731 [Branchiostoma lanceolatum]